MKEFKKKERCIAKYLEIIGHNMQIRNYENLKKKILYELPVDVFGNYLRIRRSGKIFMVQRTIGKSRMVKKSRRSK